MFLVAYCCWHHVVMADWSRLGEYVVSRRVALGLRTRDALARKSGISLRVLGDIENGRRDNYDLATLSSLERALDWETGSVRAIVAGREPAVAGIPVTRDGSITAEQVVAWGEEWIEEIWDRERHPSLSDSDRQELAEQIRVRMAGLLGVVERVRKTA